MKQKFKSEKFAGYESFFDETTNQGYAREILSQDVRKKLTKKQVRKYLDDLGTGSETEFDSAQQLNNNQVKSPEFLEYLIKCCVDKNYHLNQFLVDALIIFRDDERVFPALLKSAEKVPDDSFSNYAQVLTILGRQKAKKILLKRFNRIKDDPKVYKKAGDWNDLALSLITICEYLLILDVDNIEVAKVLVKLSKHRCHFTRDAALWRIAGVCKDFRLFWGTKVLEIFMARLNSLKKTNDIKLFTIALRYLLENYPEETYRKLVKLYQKANLQERNELAFWLSQIESSAYWISRLIRELPKKDTQPLRETLDFYLVVPISNQEIVNYIKERFQSDSPSTRVFALNHLRHIDNKNAIKLVKQALKDESDEFIIKEFEKYIKKHSK